MDAQLPVDPRTLDAGEDAQVGGEPCWVCGEREMAKEGGKVCMSWQPDATSHRLPADASVSRQTTSNNPLLQLRLESKKKMQSSVFPSNH